MIIMCTLYDKHDKDNEFNKLRNRSSKFIADLELTLKDFENNGDV